MFDELLTPGKGLYDVIDEIQQDDATRASLSIPASFREFSNMSRLGRM